MLTDFQKRDNLHTVDVGNLIRSYIIKKYTALENHCYKYIYLINCNIRSSKSDKAKTNGMKQVFEYIKHLLFGLDIRNYHRSRI